MNKVYLFLADGVEELEALSVVDVMRRGKQDVVMVSISDSLDVVSSHNVHLRADILLKDVDLDDALLLVFPGGMPGAKNLSESKPLVDLMQRHFDDGKRLAAICAAPGLMFGQLQSEETLEITCYPGFEKYAPKAKVSKEGVVIDGRVTTGKGPGFAIDFALTLLAQIASPEIAEDVAEGMLI